jgi:hypothetical protein
VPAATGLGAAAVVWALTGVGVARWVAAGGRTDVVVMDERGVRTERQGTGGTRRVVDLGWDRLHGHEFAAPTLRGWTAWYDDRGPTLEENRRDRRGRAWLCGGAAVVTGAQTAAFYAATSSDPRWWFVVLGCGWATAALTFCCGDNLLRRPRWIPGGRLAGAARGDPAAPAARVRAETLMRPS